MCRALAPATLLSEFPLRRCLLQQAAKREGTVAWRCASAILTESRLARRNFESNLHHASDRMSDSSFYEKEWPGRWRSPKNGTW